MSPFVGVGVQGFRFESVVESERRGERLRSERTTQGVTGGAFLGAEVRLARGVIVGGAYGAGVSYRKTEDELLRDLDGESVTESGRDSDRFQVGTQTSSLYLSVYF